MRKLASWLLLSSCAPPVASPPAEPPRASPAAGAEKPPAPSTEPSVPGGTDRAAPVVVVPPVPPAPTPVGCWERSYGSAPQTDGRSFQGEVTGCPGCDQLRAGPLAAGLHVDVVARLRAIEEALPQPEVDEPRIWVNSGKRDGPPHRSMHNQGLAVDLVICGMDTAETGQRLRDAGFTCVIEYYNGVGEPCGMAHGDMRGGEHAVGAYRAGGAKAKTCPKKAVSRGDSCRNQSKEQWDYSGGAGAAAGAAGG